MEQIESPEIDPDIYTQLIFYKSTKPKEKGKSFP